MIALTLSMPLGLLALGAVPAVIALHLFRRQLRQRVVAGLFLFTGQRLVADAGRKKTNLLRTPSLWLECLAAVLLALWLAGPSFGGVAARHVVIVLDDSASMGALVDGRSLADLAIADLQSRRGELASGDRLTVLRTGVRPDLLLGPRALPAELMSALPRWRPARPHHDLQPALDQARELAGADGAVWLYTDRAPLSGNDDVEVVAFGHASGNAAILSAQRFPGAEHDELRATIAGFAGAVVTQLTVLAGDRPIATQSFDLSAGPASFALPLPTATEALTLRLSPDALPIDDEVLLLPEAPHTVAICDLLSPEQRTALELPRALAALSGWRSEANPLHAQLVITTGPGALTAGQTELVMAPGDGERQAWRGPFTIDRSHPWLLGVRLQGVIWQAGTRALPGRVLVAVGNQSLLAEDDAGSGRRLWLNLDPSLGNVPRAPDWPLLLANVLDSCRPEVPGPERTNLRVGDEARWRRAMRTDIADADLTLVAPDGSRQPGRGLRTLGWVGERPGRHVVVDAQGRELGAFAIRFHDPAESDLAGAATLRRAATPRQGAAGPLRDTSFERRLLAVLLLLTLLADWWVLGRRSP
ncbi:MAG: VWA domain-containing protein [Planctomycetes bacterium]|nr:VWA domain-containing protein [Planctomycetota bacterium]